MQKEKEYTMRTMMQKQKWKQKWWKHSHSSGSGSRSTHSLLEAEAKAPENSEQKLFHCFQKWWKQKQKWLELKQ